MNAISKLLIAISVTILHSCKQGYEPKSLHLANIDRKDRILDEPNEDENKLVLRYFEDFQNRFSTKNALVQLEKSRSKDKIDTISFKDITYVEVDTSLVFQKSLLRMDVDGKLKSIIDSKKTAENQEYIFKEAFYSQNGKFVLALFSFKGSDWMDGIIFEGSTGKKIGRTIKGIKFSDIIWFKDEGFYYSAYGIDYKSHFHAKLTHQILYYHSIENPNGADAVILGKERYHKRFISASKLGDSLIYASCQNGMTENEVLIKHIDPRKNGWKWLAKGEDSENNIIGKKEDKIIYITNGNAPNKRLMAYDLIKGTHQELVPEQSGLVLMGAQIISNKILLHYLNNGKTLIRQFNKDYKFEFDIEPKAPAGFQNAELEGQNKIKINLENFFAKSLSLTYDISTGKILDDGYLENSAYESIIIQYKSTDGTEIPMYLAYKKGLKFDGTTPVYLTTYGGFGVAWPPHYQDDFYLWLQNDGLVAWPMVRGGGELGSDWHKNGRFDQKLNSIRDFVSAATFLVEQGYASPERIMITSRSYGGFLIGAATVLFPEYFKVSIPSVGVYDLLNFPDFSYGIALQSEFGDPRDLTTAHRLKTISPIHNVRDNEHCSIMVVASKHDDRVYPGQSYRFFHKLKMHQKGKNPILFRAREGGHYVGGGLSRMSRIEEVSDLLDFSWREMGYCPPLLGCDQFNN